MTVMKKLGLTLIAAGPIIGLLLMAGAVWFATRSIQAGAGEAAVWQAYAQVRMAAVMGVSIATAGVVTVVVSWFRRRDREAPIASPV
jgi:predicted phage tail protein